MIFNACKEVSAPVLCLRLAARLDGRLVRWSPFHRSWQLQHISTQQHFTKSNLLTAVIVTYCKSYFTKSNLLQLVLFVTCPWPTKLVVMAWWWSLMVTVEQAQHAAGRHQGPSKTTLSTVGASAQPCGNACPAIVRSAGGREVGRKDLQHLTASFSGNMWEYVRTC